MKRISGVYKITNTVTGDFYIGSSKDVKRRWAHHKYPSVWKNNPNNPMYLDIQKYGVEKFNLQILAEVETEHLKETEQKFIEKLKPTYNNRRANGFDIERNKEYMKEYNKEYHKEYKKSDKYKEYQKDYQKTDRYKKTKNKYRNQLCSYNGETLTLSALAARFYRAGVEHPVIEAKKYILKK